MAKTKQQSESRAGILSAISDWLKLLGLIVLVAEAFLTTVIVKTSQPDPYVTLGIGLVGLIVIGLFYDRYIQARIPRGSIGDHHTADSKRNTNPEQLDGLIADAPISAQNVARWLGRWNCRWMIHVEGSHLAPYIDDGITLQHIASETGTARGVGHTAYGSGGTYKVKGRIIGGRIGIFIYSSDESLSSGLDGMFIVRMNAVGEVSGWWVGRGRDGMEIGGRVILERYKDNEPFEPKLYPYPPPKVSNAS
jgi:hypothetical protein